MQSVANGDIARASVLFERYHVSVYGYLARLNKDKSLAQDMTQNVFEKMIKYKASYKNQQCFKAWLFTIARNTNIDHHRKKKYHMVSDDIDMVDGCKSAQVIMERDERHRTLNLALDRLPEHEKELIVLTKFEKMKYSEVAQITGLSESALKVKVHRTIKKLKTILINDLKYEY